jgi:hypothetical protein
MSDTLYLSLWYPNLRLPALAEKLTAVLGAFAQHGGEARVYSATVWPVSWKETPVFQQIYGRRIGQGDSDAVELGADPSLAVEDALELLHEDCAYEFQIGWTLWEAEIEPARPADEPQPIRPPTGAEAEWVKKMRLVRVVGYGPLFDEGCYESEGHIRVEFGPDSPFLEEDVVLDSEVAHHVEENVRQLVQLTASIEEESGATARLLWSELGESLAQRLAARLGVKSN